MEVSTVPPPPASPAKGDDSCEIDVTNVAVHTVTLLIGLCGLAGNGAVLRLISLKSRNSDIFYLAFVDFLFLLFVVPSALLFLVEDVSCSPVMPLVYVRFLFQLSVVSYYWVLFWMTGRMDIIEKLCRLYCRCRLPKRLRWLLNSFQYWAFFSLFTVMPTVTFLCPAHEQEQCRAALISMFTVILLLFAAPVVIIRTIDFIKAKCGSQQQQPERRNTVVFLTMVFSLFLSLWNFLQQLGYIVVSSKFFFLLTCTTSSIKPFLYFLVGRCWNPCSMGSLRLSLQRVFEEEKDKTSHSNDATRDTVV